ncbi:SIR2 family NAD-dependent protein deacylase [Anaerostipes sp.]|uniref:SIR2 family NAD-dependent protein deacylase n=1 Tax=Anaerostipes sp. TaxID=1872530 RepID=UPI0025B90257|nr:Sir2 silent information regulator family NAD-dependent deacetylase [Anaerostipes sp.]MBS7009230.1 Sir2 silent information regulator family NAD-dependent deacetylase [Anaerostipes sp.]
MICRNDIREKETENAVSKLRQAMNEADAVMIGAGAGLSLSAGFMYSGDRFQKYFPDFIEKYGFRDAYSGGFHSFKSLEENWAYWSRYIYISRYTDAPKPVYTDLLGLVKGRDYFVLTTNVDHQFQKAGFDKNRLFCTQGDYGRWQCSQPCHDKTYDNEKIVKQMTEAQGFKTAENGNLIPPEHPKMRIPSDLVPECPVCGRPMSMNLRADDTFVEDGEWHRAAHNYDEFIKRHQNLKILFLELGAGMNTPTIIKFNFWRMTHQWKDAVYACINLNDVYVPQEIEKKSICIRDDIGAVLKQLQHYFLYL